MAWSHGEWYDTAEDQQFVREWCPECDPAGVPEPYTLHLCGEHTPSLDGSADVEARGESGSFWMSGSADTDAGTNAEFCKLLHRS